MNYFSEQLKKATDIPFDIIDEGMHDLIYIFNYLGLKTRFCCSGHGERFPYIMLDESVSVEQAGALMTIATIVDECDVNFWVRYTEQLGLLKNWIWEYHILDLEQHIVLIDAVVAQLAEHYSIPREVGL